MKLAFCLFNYFAFGGLQRDFLRIAQACYARGHEIHVYTMTWQAEPPEQFHLHLIKVPGWQNHVRCRRFVQAIQPELSQYDLVIGFNKMPGLDIYYAADVCYQAHAHKKHRWFYRLLPRYRQWLAFEQVVFAENKTTAILLLTTQQQKEYTAYYYTPPERFHALPPGISKDRLVTANTPVIREKLRATYAIPTDHFILLMVASAFKTKGVDRAMIGLAHLPAYLQQRCVLWVVGADDPHHYLLLAKKLSIDQRIHFFGGRSDVADFLQTADLLLHPARLESAGAVLLEAVAAGLPVLTVDVCGYAPYIIQANAGQVLASPFQQDVWDKAMTAMLTALPQAAWRTNALTFTQTADLFSLPEKAADLIEEIGKHKPAYTTKSDVYYLHPSLTPYFSTTNALFDQIMALSGQIFRKQKGRITQRVQIGSKYYFLKLHTGVGWKEIIKNLLQGRWPALSAKNEWRALNKLHTLGVAVPRVLGFGQRWLNPARQQSFLLMEEIAPAVSLEVYCQSWRTAPPRLANKQVFIAKVAQIARQLHQHGINHRDFYICHFLLLNGQANNPLCLIDLHRAQIRHVIPTRWRIKDLAGLYFSSKDIGLTQHDYYRFMKIYYEQPLRDVLNSTYSLWKKVKTRGEQLYRDHAQ
ncbi:MAG TPA: lipopolysaccharide core heptose(I) kinase RfaP [Gammaproteobacteria bacterium]|jgi:UDP-glucose:(heptosyl)LPS alpha-1,3-glucosyltransferase|nr:lipopolysaccharide core heptose(I) kinase RfaP [Gammaproteobacteria bacterium]